MNHFPFTYRFSGVCTSIGSDSTIPSRVPEKIRFIRKIAFIDKKKWDIKSYREGDYESDEYGDPYAIYIYVHERDLVAGCVQLLPSGKPIRISGTLTAEQIRLNSKPRWKAARLALLADHTANVN
ncbi:acyl-homoserine-lactone synthase [Pseudomonas sp. TH31]|uniref:acyl-homoserine-lactone synthase n=1 Tax=Pseudomonas sp. TH31 TaxID=2796396 RepID=UPI001914AA54|nr:acyl-homoserine-lactone synthase [Pseudomonas sp. TH31]MBK5418665.1 hypothetical protein [Pseudomonas sp. TH31]